MTVKEVLIAAAAYIERFGWLQGTTGIRTENDKYVDGPVCAYGALYRIVVDPTNLFGTDRTLLNQCTGVLHNHLGQGIASWNDDYKNRTKDDVINLFRTVAAEQP